jgi:hypothetical protein
MIEIISIFHAIRPADAMESTEIIGIGCAIGKALDEFQKAFKSKTELNFAVLKDKSLMEALDETVGRRTVTLRNLLQTKDDEKIRKAIKKMLKLCEDVVKLHAQVRFEVSANT